MARELESWSPSHSIGQSEILRRYLQIPKEQQKLLERPDAWSPSGAPNIPPHVLKDVRDHYARKIGLGSTNENETPSSQPSSPLADRTAASSLPASPVQRGKEGFSSQPASPVQDHTVRDQSTEASVEDGDSEEHEEDVSGTPIPWSSSPAAHRLGPSRLDDLSAPARSSPQQLRTWSTRKPAQLTSLLVEFPTSSSLASDPLEVEVPKAITDISKPAGPQAAAVLEPTPPSAQIIPATIAAQTSPGRAPEAKRRRLMRRILASPDRTLGRSTMATVCSSVVHPEPSRSPSPVVKSSFPISNNSLRHAVGESSAIPSAEGPRLSTRAAQPDIILATSQLIPNHLSSNFADKLPPNGPSSQLPFTAFKVAYPEFTGSLGDFIRGVMVIMKLQKDSALPQFLYDDFIRVFSGEYLDYIKTLDENQQAIPALKWYNENVSQPLYTKRVLTKSNVKGVLERYPDKVRIIQQKAAGANRRASTPATQNEPDRRERDEDISQQAPIPTETPTRTRHSSPRATNAAGSSPPQLPIYNRRLSPGLMRITEESPRANKPGETIAQPANTITSFRPVSAREASTGTTRSANMANFVEPTARRLLTQVDSSFPEIERTQTPYVAKARLLLDMLSQQSNPESIPETTLKPRRPPQASNVPYTGEPSASFKRPKRKAEDPRARSEQWKKYLQRKVQSSAPGGSTAS